MVIFEHKATGSTSNLGTFKYYVSTFFFLLLCLGMEGLSKNEVTASSGEREKGVGGAGVVSDKMLTMANGEVGELGPTKCLPYGNKMNA